MEVQSKKRVGILRGGNTDDYIFSLHKGGEIILHILENLNHKYKTFDILVDTDGVWHLNGLPIVPADLIHKVDVVWNTAEPSFSVILDNLSISNIGVNSFHSLFKNNRQLLKEHIKDTNVSLPRRFVLPVFQKDFDGPREKYAVKKAKEVFEKFSSPWIVQSFVPKVGMGIHLAKTFPELVRAIEDGAEHGASILVEEFIAGKVASVHSVPNFRGEELYVFPPVNVFGQLSSIEKDKLSLLVRHLHQHLSAEHYLKTNFILNKRGKVYLIDLDHTPNLKSFSHFSQACESVGAKMHHIIEHIIG